MPVEIARAPLADVEGFLAISQREALHSLYGFNVVWHEERHAIAARDRDRLVGAALVRIAASLAHLECVVVTPHCRNEGIGRDMLAQAADLASYYNCHKICVLVPDESAAQRFFERCGYHTEAVLPQHTFKLDIAAMRKFLL